MLTMANPRFGELYIYLCNVRVNNKDGNDVPTRVLDYRLVITIINYFHYD